MIEFVKKGGQKLEKIWCKNLILWLLLAFSPMICIVSKGIEGLVIGFLTVGIFLITEGIGLLLKSRTRSWEYWISYIIMLLSLSGIAVLVLQLMMPKFMQEIPPLFLAAGFCLNIFLMRSLVGILFQKKEEAREETLPGFWRQFLSKAEISVEFLIFLALFSGLRELLGGVILFAQLLPGGFCLTAFLLMVWKMTGEMPEKLGKLPVLTLSTGLILMIFYGLAGFL